MVHVKLHKNMAIIFLLFMTKLHGNESLKSCWIELQWKQCTIFKVPIIIRNSAVSKIILCIFWPRKRNKMLLTRVLLKVKGIYFHLKWKDIKVWKNMVVVKSLLNAFSRQSMLGLDKMVLWNFLTIHYY